MKKLSEMDRKERKKEANRRWRATPKGKESKRLSHLRGKYGISEKQLLAIYSRQRGRCAICNREIGLYNNRNTLSESHIDHDHQKGQVRGLLCLRCNVGLGQFDDSIERLYNAIKYLEDMIYGD